MLEQEQHERKLEVDPILVAWCRNCEMWLPEEDIGDYCPHAPDCPRKLIKRRMFVCSKCERAFGMKRDYRKHLCHEFD